MCKERRRDFWRRFAMKKSHLDVPDRFMQHVSSKLRLGLIAAI